MTIRLHGEKNSFNQDDLINFENMFRDIHQRIFEELNVKRPVAYRVNLAENASIFAKLTGKNWYVAAVYDPFSDAYYFQNIKSLNRQKIIKSVIAHEVCHQALFIERGGIQKDDFHIYDESFCEAFYPAMIRNVMNKIKPADFQSFSEWKHYIEDRLNSPVRENVYGAYRQMQLWGNYLIETLGTVSAFQMSARGDNLAFEKIFKAYKIKNDLTGR